MQKITANSNSEATQLMENFLNMNNELKKENMQNYMTYKASDEQ